MKTLIAYKQNDEVLILHPILNCGLTIEEIASKDVPVGLPYVFVDNEHNPIDWDKPDGTGLGAELFFSIQANAEQAIAEISAQIESQE